MRKYQSKRCFQHFSISSRSHPKALQRPQPLSSPSVGNWHWRQYQPLIYVIGSMHLWPLLHASHLQWKYPASSSETSTCHDPLPHELGCVYMYLSSIICRDPPHPTQLLRFFVPDMSPRVKRLRLT